MKITLKPETIRVLEETSGQRISKNGDIVIRHVAEMAQNAENGNGIEMQVCETTVEEMKQKVA